MKRAGLHVRREEGTAILMVAAALFLLLGVAAFVVDLSSMRLDRAADQKVADMAATAGALALFQSDAVAGCEAALGYVSINMGGLPVSTSGCTTYFASTCDPSVERSFTPSSTGRFEITVVNPVPDGHQLMVSGILGAGAQDTTNDGAPCDRIAVRIEATHQAFIAQVLGFTQASTTVHAVARAFLPPPDGPPINLLLLDRHDCEVLKASGQGGVIVDAIYDADTNSLVPGEGAVDSDGADCVGTQGGTIFVEGSNSIVRADGPAGCAEQLGTEPFGVGSLTKGLGCGILRTLAPGTPGCNWPACTGSGANNPAPEPIGAASRITRAPIDHRYNCRADYATTLPSSISWAASPLTTTNEQDIVGCSGGSAHIDQLISSTGQTGNPGGFATWSAAYPCDVPSSHPTITLTGNVWIDCATFNLRTTLTITGGSVVADGNVSVTSGTGVLRIDNSSGTPGYLFLRGGLFRKDGQASIFLDETMVYASKTSRVEMEGGTGSLSWIAPDDPSHPFDDLALWSDSEVTSAPHRWAGQASLTLEGVFFVPIVTVEYAGQGAQQQTEAQFISDKLHARGNGFLVVSPTADRAVGLRPPPQTVLLR